MVTNQARDPESDLPTTIGNPARNTLRVSGITRLDQLTGKTESEILALHGMGPKALGLLRDALAARGQAFKVATNKR